MKHVAAIASWCGLTVSPAQWAQLEGYVAWLTDEGTTAGGIGPHEANRVWERHIADSISFCEAATSGGRMIDIGTGVGLPAVPLAVLHPECHVVALDRSGRRIDLLSRVCRIIGLENLEPRRGDVERVGEHFTGLTSRGVAGPEQTMRWAHALLAPGGIGLMGFHRGTTGAQAPAPTPGLDVSLVEVPDGLLDDTVTLLRMVRRVDE